MGRLWCDSMFTDFSQHGTWNNSCTFGGQKQAHSKELLKVAPTASYGPGEHSSSPKWPSFGPTITRKPLGEWKGSSRWHCFCRLGQAGVHFLQEGSPSGHLLAHYRAEGKPSPSIRDAHLATEDPRWGHTEWDVMHSARVLWGLCSAMWVCFPPSKGVSEVSGTALGP